MKTIAFLGLGNMCLPMASNLRKAGFDVCAHDSQAVALDAAQRQGLRTAASIESALDGSETVIRMVPNVQLHRLLLVSESVLPLARDRPGITGSS